MPKPKDLVLVDGSSYLFRAFHALPPLVNSRGNQANGDTEQGAMGERIAKIRHPAPYYE